MTKAKLVRSSLLKKKESKVTIKVVMCKAKYQGLQTMWYHQLSIRTGVDHC